MAMKITHTIFSLLFQVPHNPQNLPVEFQDIQKYLEATYKVCICMYALTSLFYCTVCIYVCMYNNDFTIFLYSISDVQYGTKKTQNAYFNHISSPMYSVSIGGISRARREDSG